MDLTGRNFLTLKDFSPEEILYLLDLAADLKEKKAKKIPVDIHRGKNIALIFEKTSTRTRCAFEVAAHDLGISTTYLAEGSQIGKKESIADTARVLGRMFDGIEYRGYQQSLVEDLAKYSGVVVWNGLTNEYHPTQMLADMLTIREHYGKINGLKLVYYGDARYNIGNSLCIVSSKLGLNLTLCAPEKYFPDKKLIEECNQWAKESGASITLESDIKKATKDADILYTDVWVSMGDEKEAEQRQKDFAPYQVNSNLMSLANDGAIFMHCLPAIRGQEVSGEVIDGPQSVVFDEAENRLHAQKAVLYHFLK